MSSDEIMCAAKLPLRPMGRERQKSTVRPGGFQLRLERGRFETGGMGVNAHTEKLRNDIGSVSVFSLAFVAGPSPPILANFKNTKDSAQEGQGSCVNREAKA